MGVAVAAPTLFDQLENVRLDENHLTLDSLIVTTWKEARVQGVAECPICGGRMKRADREPQHAGGMLAICGECGTDLS